MVEEDYREYRVILPKSAGGYNFKGNVVMPRGDKDKTLYDDCRSNELLNMHEEFMRVFGQEPSQ